MMKKLLITVAIVGMAVCTQAQGLVNFNNRVASVAARIFDADGVTPLLGTGFEAQIYGIAGVTAVDTSLVAKGNPVSFGTTASASGYVLTAGTGVTPAVDVGPAGTYTFQVRAWTMDTPTSTYATSSKVGKSNLFQVDAAASPAPTPNLVGLQSFHLNAPEPTTVALGVLGLSVLLFRRRK